METPPGASLGVGGGPEDGAAIGLARYRGRVLVLTFIYTRRSCGDWELARSGCQGFEHVLPGHAG